MAKKARNKRFVSPATEAPTARIQLAGDPTPTPQQSSPYSIGINAAICSFLVVVVALTFVQTAGYEFVNFGDDSYVYQNFQVRQGLTLSGIEQAFSGSDAGNWHPLTWISHMVDCQVYKSWAGGHHLTSAAIHATVAVLLFLTLLRMTGSRWPSAVVAAVFAIHPLRVESVAWIAQRKDVLSGLFFVLTLAAYLHYLRRGESLARYLLLWFVYLLGLMCKPMLVTLPLVLLLLDYWPLGRFGRADRGAARPGAWAFNPVVEKIPLLVLSLMSCAVTIIVQPDLVATNRIALPVRLGNALVSYAAYLCQFFWPARLAVLYPYPREKLGLVAVLGSLVLLVFISWVVVVERARRPYLLVGWLWYLIMLLPVIGLVQVGMQARADRYTYLALTGPCLAVVWAVAELVRSRGWLRPLLGLATCTALTLLLTVAWRQATTWRDSMSLWTHALASGCESGYAHDALASVCFVDGKFQSALQHYQDALRLSPESVRTHINYGLLLVLRGQVDAGIEQYKQALKIDPQSSSAETNFRRALVVRGDIAAAAAHFNRALEIDPENAWAYYHLGDVLMRQGRLDEAAAALEKSLQLNPDLAAAANDLANILRRFRRYDEAVARYRHASRLPPIMSRPTTILARSWTTSDRARRLPSTSARPWKSIRNTRRPTIILGSC